MKKTLIALAAVASFGMSSSVMAAAGEGVVNFKGTVVNAACGIAPESADQTIDFGQLSQVHLENGGISTKMPLEIKLVNCVLDAEGSPNNNVMVTFGGNTVAPEMLGTAGGTGTGIVISAQDGKPVTFGTATAPQKFLAGDNTLHFSTWVQKSAATGATVKEGAFTAVSNFTMTYQ